MRPEAIVIHVMAGSLAGTDSWFASAESQVSAHYGIGKNGEVHQYVEEENTAFHAGTVDRPSWPLIKKATNKSFINPNLYTIGIQRLANCCNRRSMEHPARPQLRYQASRDPREQALPWLGC
jgi:N-acetylmuramoyl-L-alanine amidase